MKNDTNELAAVEAAAQEFEVQRELTEAQLVLVGGGVGEVVFT